MWERCRPAGAGRKGALDGDEDAIFSETARFRWGNGTTLDFADRLLPSVGAVGR